MDKPLKMLQWSHGRLTVVTGDVQGEDGPALLGFNGATVV